MKVSLLHALCTSFSCVITQIYYIFPPVIFFILDGMLSAIMVSMSKTMKKYTIVDRLLDWWLTGFFQYNFPNAAQVEYRSVYFHLTCVFGGFVIHDIGISASKGKIMKVVD